MPTQVWTVDYEGHLITVTNHSGRFALRADFSLAIDGENRIRQLGKAFHDTMTLFSHITTPSGTKLIEVHLGKVLGKFQVGCHILVDDKLVGGDVGAQLTFTNGIMPWPDPAGGTAHSAPRAMHWESVQKAGLLRLMIRKVPRAIALASFMVFMLKRDEPTSDKVFFFVFYAITGGVIFGYSSWREGRARYTAYTNARDAAQRLVETRSAEAA